MKESHQKNYVSNDQKYKTLNLEKHLKFMKNNSLFRRSKDSLNLTNMEAEFKENLLEGDDCSSKFEQTQFLENASSRTWKKMAPMSNRASLLLSKQFETEKFGERAIQLIRVTNEGNFEVTKEGGDFLKMIDGPIVVLGVAGMYRTGKSYLLNKVILRSEKGFGVAPTINACTKGIWIFGKPFRVKLEDGRFANLLVMDSEGLGALDQDSGHDCRIFALVLLLSSMFLYNSVGTIDENAISSLSLVINLTRHIKVKQKTYKDAESEDEEDPEELAKFFPSFLWVLRDFSLELENMMGEAISPQQYLENSLAAHKGISDEVERKNRVRRIIKQFFPERNCFPLVRPLVNEDDLQRLNDLPMEKLRPEFVSQSLHLRELLFSKSRPKKMHNSEINGHILCGLAHEYVRAINGGAVPNIESAWTYVCSAQREKLRMELINAFEEDLEDLVIGKLPMEEDKLEGMVKEVKAKIKRRFEKECLDGIDQDEKRRLKEGLKEKQGKIVLQNRSAMEDLVNRVMNEGFRDQVEEPLENYKREKMRLKEEESQSNQGMERGLLEQGDTCEWVDRETKTWGKLQNGLSIFMEKMMLSLKPLTPLKQKMLYSFLMNKLMKNGAEQYQDLVKCMKLAMLEKDSKIGLLIEKARGCEELLSKVKKTSKQRIEELEETVECLELEREAQERRIEVQARELKSEMKEKEKNFDEENRELRTQMEKIEEKERKELEKHRKILEGLKKDLSEWETKEMLLKQKIEFLEKEKKEWVVERGRLNQRVRDLEEQMEYETEELRNTFEVQIKGLRQEHKVTKDQFREYKDEVTQQSILQESMCRQISTKEEDMMQQVERMKRDLKEAKRNEDEAFLKCQNIERELEELRRQTQSDEDRKNKNNVQAMELKKELGLEKKKQEKQEALWNQKISFLEEERDELKEQLQDLRKVHEKVVATIKMQSSSREEKKGGMGEKVKKAMECRIAELEETNMLLEGKMKEDARELQKQKEELLEEGDKMREECLKLEGDLQAEREKSGSLTERLERMGDQQKRIVKDTESLWKDKVKRAESEAEKERSNRNMLLMEERQEGEKRMQEMRDFFEEKQGATEEKWKMEREAGERKRRELIQEWEERMNESRAEFEEELEELERKVTEYEDLIADSNDRADKMKKEVERRIQGERLEKEKIGGELRARLALELQKVENLEAELSKEREEKKGSFEELKKELVTKNAELGEIRQRMELVREKGERERVERSMKERKLKEDLESYGERFDHLKSEKDRLAGELIKMRNDFSKEMALNQQSLGFKEKKIQELEDKIEVMGERQQKEVQRLKSSYGGKLEEMRKTQKEDLAEVEQRLEEKRQALKEVELSTQEKVIGLEKENTKLQEQVRGLEERVEEYMENRGRHSEEAERKLVEVKEMAKKKRSALEEELDKQREKAYEAEISLTETLARLDKEEALWKGKFEFLKQQRNQLKLDLSESQKNFDMMVNKLQEYRTEANTEREESLSKQIEEMRHRHQVELAEQRNKHQSRENEYADRIGFLENEVGRLERVNQQTVSKRFGNRLSEEKRLNELLEKEKLLQDEVMMLKCEKDSIGLVYQREMEKEREQWKLKMFEMECSIKKAENERNLLVFEHEKQRTKWMIERDNWVFHKQEHVESIEKLQRQKDHLTKENERLKGNIKVLKKSNLGHSIMSFAKSRYINTPKKL